MTKPQLFIPPVAGEDTPSMVRWMRHASSVLNEFMRRMSTGAFFVWDEGCVNVPTSTTIANAEELIFESPFEGNGTLVVTGVGFEGGVHVALNETDLGTLSNANTTNPILYEVQVENLIDGLNSFEIWSDSADTGELRKLEVWRNFSRDLIDTSGTTAEWGNVTGAGKPEDNADVTADHGQPPSWLTALVASGDIDAASVEAVLDALNLINSPNEAGADNTANQGQPPSWLTALVASGDIDASSVEAVLDALNTINAPQEAGANVTETRESLADWEATLTFTPAWNGFSVNPSGSIKYAISKDGRWAKMFWTDDQTGTSNDNVFSLTNLPAAIRPAGASVRDMVATGMVEDSGETRPMLGGCRIAEASHGSAGTVEFGFMATGGGALDPVQLERALWTNTGTKGILAGTQIMWTLG